MFRRSLYIALAAATVLTLTASANDQGQEQGFNDNQFAGTWIHQAPLGPGLTFQAMLTLHSGGTVTATGSLMFGGVQGATGRFSPMHGLWEKTGHKTISGVCLMYIFDANGILTGISRDHWTLEFSRDFNSYKGTEYGETVSCPSPLSCPDPNDPNVVWTPGSPPSGFPVFGTRLILAPAGPPAH